MYILGLTPTIISLYLNFRPISNLIVFFRIGVMVPNLLVIINQHETQVPDETGNLEIRNTSIFCFIHSNLEI